jgi:hypothetical protein
MLVLFSLPTMDSFATIGVGEYLTWRNLVGPRVLWAFGVILF